MGVARAEMAADPAFVIVRSVNRDGATYALAPGMGNLLRARFGNEFHTRSRVFIAHETHADIERVAGAVAPQVVILLTGLSEDRIREAFGPVTFRDAVTEQDLPRA